MLKQKQLEEDFRTRFTEEVGELSQCGLRPFLSIEGRVVSLRIDFTDHVKSASWRKAWTIIDQMQEWVQQHSDQLNSKNALFNRLLSQKANGYSWETLTDCLNRDLMGAIYEHCCFPKRQTIKKVRTILTDLGFSKEEIQKIILDGAKSLKEHGQVFPDIYVPTGRKVPLGAWKRIDGPIEKSFLRNTLKEPWKEYQALLSPFLKKAKE